MNMLKVNGIELIYDSYGSETDETILLIVGLGTQMIRWTVPFCEILAARGYRVIRFDNRDTGLSTHFNHHNTLDFEAIAKTLVSGQLPVIPYTLDDMTDDTIGLLDALGIKNAHVVGRSMGGMIAQLVASRYPERVLSLTSIMSTTGNPELPPTSPDVMALMTRPACGKDTAHAISGAEFMLLEGMGHDLPAQLFETVVDGIVRTAQRKG
ncbi:alpha/beta fold hydrolase [Paenibacillus sp. FSL H7-689]|uniref:alpha/beta fold hydrolase n=1 Tax=Paenibacillus sp. FSL H7-689 TaxID=1227349 RepID=UPI0003E24BFB|nr:alpha/beta hydrolase [Paenibacillus sp. FSL H7-689]ETT47853.1 alpha/beta hydrolase fold protein [Paenibacillus sp. FSL H7-689]